MFAFLTQTALSFQNNCMAREKMLKIIINGFPAMGNKNNVCLIKPLKPEKLLELIELKLKEENGRL